MSEDLVPRIMYSVRCIEWWRVGKANLRSKPHQNGKVQLDQASARVGIDHTKTRGDHSLFSHTKDEHGLERRTVEARQGFKKPVIRRQSAKYLVRNYK